MIRAIDRLASFVAETGDRDIPDAVLKRAGDCMLDALGAAAAGLSAASTRAMSRAMPLHDGTSRVWFTDRSGDAITAATLNAMAATALDIDDGHRQAAGHPGAAVVASALAGARPDMSGAELLTAVVLGYEVSVRVALARIPEHHRSTVSGRWSGTGAAAVMAKLQGLPPDMIAQSILIAEQHAPRVGSALSHGFAGSDVKEGIAWSVQSGLQAVELAKAGFRGYPDTFDQGVLYDPEVLVCDLGSFDAISGLFFKPYACCRWIHAAIDGLTGIMARHDLHADDIQAVTVRTFERAVELGNQVAPKTEAEAQFSIPFCLGVAAVRGPDALTPMDPALLSDAEVLAFSGKVSAVQDPEMEALFPRLAPAVVNVVVGTDVLSLRIEAAFGDPTNPMSRADLDGKFQTLAGPVLGPERTGALIAWLADPLERPAGALLDLLDHTTSGVFDTTNSPSHPQNLAAYRRPWR